MLPITRRDSCAITRPPAPVDERAKIVPNDPARHSRICHSDDSMWTLSKNCSGRPTVRSGHDEEVRQAIARVSGRLERDQLKLPTTPADIGMLPIPKKPRIDFPVITSDSMKTEEQPARARNSQDKEKCDCASQSCCGFSVIENSDQANQAPEEGETNWNSPQH